MTMTYLKNKNYKAESSQYLRLQWNKTFWVWSQVVISSEWSEDFFVKAKQQLGTKPASNGKTWIAFSCIQSMAVQEQKTWRPENFALEALSLKYCIAGGSVCCGFCIEISSFYLW